MKFECPYCGQHLTIETIHQGVGVDCPACGKPLTVPDKPSEEVVRTLQSNIDRAERTISQYMQEKQLEGGVELGDSKDSSTASQYITSDQGQKYQLGKVVASGGMGAIIDAKEHNLRRKVAMKVMLNPDQETQESILRFIEEAQVTGQLEHPGIVPVYELGVDASGNVFYTMKMIKGVTLKDILKEIAEGDKQTIKEYPLSRLLTIYQRVCDAIAFAHHKGVIHRDLKPENIMVGEYGEVQVMDWGLAKVLGRPERKGAAGGKGDGNIMHIEVDSIRRDASADIMKTMDGAIMGTPGYMAPEQATGKLEAIDQRSDIYSLGAILYNILTLNKPISFTTLDEFLEKVGTGEIPNPTTYNSSKGKSQRLEVRDKEQEETPEDLTIPQDGSSPSTTQQPNNPTTAAASGLPHCPNGRVPESLAAVAMKALATDAGNRYQSVKDLQADIEAYQNGFATSAEEAGAWKQIKLFIRRNRIASISSVIVLLAVLGGGGVAVNQGIKAQRNLRELRGTAPDLIDVSKRFVEQKNLAAAVERARYAVSLVPENVEYRLHLANLLQASLAFNEAKDEYSAVLKLDTSNASAARNKALCENLLKKHAGDTDMQFLAVQELYPRLIEQERYSQALAMFTSVAPSAKNVGGLRDLCEERLRERGITFRNLSITQDGLIELDLSGTSITNLSSLNGLPLAKLNLTGTAVSDLLPLKGMPLSSLNIMRCVNVSDLSPLRGMPLRSLSMGGAAQVHDLAPLRGMPLEHLTFDSTKVSNISPLEGMPLKQVWMGKTGITDLSAFRGMKTLTGLSGPIWSVLDRADKTLIAKDIDTAKIEYKAVIVGYEEVPVFAACTAYARDMLAFLEAPVNSHQDVKSFNGHHYWHSGEREISWIDAKLVCEAMGGHLVTLGSAQERDFVMNLCRTQEGCHIGLSARKNATPEWISGEEWNNPPWFKKTQEEYGILHLKPYSIYKRGEISGAKPDIRPFVIEWEK